MRILFIGDVVGRPGRTALKRRLPALRSERQIDFVIANGENAAGGAGITEATFRELRDADVDVVTTGNHVWAQREVMKFIDREPRLLRPLNFPSGAKIPGRGSGVFRCDAGQPVAVLNLLGRVNLGHFEDPFTLGRREAEALRRETPVVVIDFHAEVTSEKIAFAWHLDGHVSAVIGTHTHVQTADERVLPEGTAHICDVGMTGPHDSVLGVRKEIIIQKFLDQLPCRHEVAKGDVRICGAILDIDDETGRARSIVRLSESIAL